MKSKTRMLVQVLLVLALVVSVFRLTTPAEASMMNVDIRTIPEFPNIYYLGDTVYYELRVTNPDPNTKTNTLDRIWATLPNGTVIEFLYQGSPYGNANDGKWLVQEPGDVDTFYVQYVVAEADLEWIDPFWRFINRFDAEGFDNSTFPDQICAMATRNSRVIRPELSIEKTVDFNKDGVFNDLETYYAGEPADWKIVITNTGFDQVYDIYVSDDNMGVDFHGPFDLAPGESEIVPVYTTYPMVDTVNTACAQGVDDLGNPVGPVCDQAEVVIAGTGSTCPDQPINISPTNGASGVSLTPTLTSSAFSDPDLGDTHGASQWQIRTSAGTYSSAVFDSGIDNSNLTSIAMAAGTLAADTTYYWHVRHQDNHGVWSSYSDETSFATISSPPPTTYPLTISSSTGGSVTTPGEGSFTYDAGTVVNLVATPDSGCEFVNWTGDVGTIANVNAASTTIAMNGNYSITANFVAVFGLTIASTTGGSVTTPGEGSFSYDAGTAVSLVASPASGYQFVNWTGDVGTVANVNAASTTVTMNGNYSITANFGQLTKYDLTTSSTSGGSVTAPGEGTIAYYDGTVVKLVATQVSGYYFVNWTGDVGTVANVHAPTTTVVMNGDYVIRANFALIPPAQNSLTVTSTTGGSVTTPGEGAFLYEPGTVVDLVATPDAGYQFTNWTGNVDTIADVSANSTTITMNGDYTITAEFAEIPRNELTISSNLGGDVTTPGEGTFVYERGAVVNLVATPADGYRFVNWTGNVISIANVHGASTTITMNDTYSITANFEAVSTAEYVLSISKTTGGLVTDPGEGIFTYIPDTIVNLVAEPEEGYQFVSWTGDVGTIDDIENAETTITMQGDYSVTASFKAVSRCFIATAAYGTSMAAEVGILRDFRDEYLLTDPIGRALVDLYYQVSPPMAEFITHNPSLKPIVRIGLAPVIAMSTAAVNNPLSQKVAIVGSLVLISVAMAIWATRRRYRRTDST